MAELVLITFSDLNSPLRGRPLLKFLRYIALANIPQDDRHYKVGPINRNRFKITIPGGEGTIDPDSAFFDHDELDLPIISLIYNLAKAGGMAMVDSAGPTSTILFNPTPLKNLPPEFRRPKPALCASADHLAKILGVSTKKSPARKTQNKKHDWSTDHNNRSRGRLPGLVPNPNESIIYVESTLDEDLEQMMKRFSKFLRDKKLITPKGGGIWPEPFQLRLRSAEIFIPWRITGYESRPNSDHLIPSNIQTWLHLARLFAKQTKRKLATIENAKTLKLNTRRLPLTQLESRPTPD
jgi:hypothetical protein